MALTSAERKSFDKIVVQLSTSDRWFTWRTAPRTRRGLWARRQLWHVIGTALATWGIVTAAQALLVTSTVAAGSAVAHAGQRMRAATVWGLERLAGLLRACRRRACRHKNQLP